MALIDIKFGQLIGQHYCDCPLCNRSIKAQAEKVRREIDMLGEPVTLYRPYFYFKHCGSLKHGGYHIGNGGIESSNKFISHVRLKISGAWWYPTNANNVLKLRCGKYNEPFDRIMENKEKK